MLTTYSLLNDFAYTLPIDVMFTLPNDVNYNLIKRFYIFLQLYSVSEMGRPQMYRSRGTTYSFLFFCTTASSAQTIGSGLSRVANFFIHLLD